VILLAQIGVIAIIQSVVFTTFLHQRGEKNNFIWDLYLGTNIPAFLFTIAIGSILKIYFPIYFLSLLGLYYLIFNRFLKNRKLIEVLTYFAINIYVVFGAILLFTLSNNITVIFFTLCAFCFITALLFSQKYILGVYAMPFLYYVSLIVHDGVFVQSVVAAFLKGFKPDIFFYDDIFIYVFFCLLVFMELRYNKLLKLREKDAEKQLLPDYEYIMKFRTQHL